ncbi:sodium:solute symporter family protein [Desulfovirgula thermocuniculi]|uniref:sodium:solute symporter family protein n=1 Tax=Desulfovirgula thermocuniculi TaxID=348842 RepID=UPI000406FFC2|nr:sodium/solute symporter [Desulfovirgula thermocuniculi]
MVSGTNPWVVGIFIVYFIVLLYFGLIGYRKTKTLADYLVAGNSMGLLLGVGTFAATWMSAVSLLGLPGYIYAYGLNGIYYGVGSWFFATVPIIILAYKLRRKPVTTVPEFYLARYNSRPLQALGGALIALFYILYVVIQLRGFGIVVNTMTGIPYEWAVIGCWVFLIYTTFGGFYSVAWTDLMNFIVLTIGAWVAAIAGIAMSGGLGEMFATLNSLGTVPLEGAKGMPGKVTPPGGLLDAWTLTLWPWLTMVGVFMGWGLGHAANPQYAVRLLASRDIPTAARMGGYSVAAMCFSYLGVILAGLAARALVPTLPAKVGSIDYALPYVANQLFHPILVGFLLTGIAAAAISSANSQLLLMASGISYDIVKFFRPNIDDKKLLTYSKAAVALGSLVSLAIALNPPKAVLIFGGYVWGLFAATFLAPVYLGCFWKRGTKEGAFVGIILGFIAAVLWTPMWTGMGGKSPVHPAVLGVVASVAGYVVASLLSKPTPVENLKHYFDDVEGEARGSSPSQTVVSG